MKMIYIDKVWQQVFMVMERKREMCRALLYKNFRRRNSERKIAEGVFLAPLLTEMSEEERSRLNELLKQDNFMEFIEWR